MTFDFWDLFWDLNGIAYAIAVVLAARKMYKCKGSPDWIDYVLIFMPIVNVYTGFSK